MKNALQQNRFLWKRFDASLLPLLPIVNGVAHCIHGVVFVKEIFRSGQMIGILGFWIVLERIVFIDVLINDSFVSL